MTPNRVVAVVTALITLALAILPVVGDFDWQSTAGVIAGIIALLGIVQKWLEGWQAHEQRTIRYPSQGRLEEPELDDPGFAQRTPQHEHTGLA